MVRRGSIAESITCVDNLLSSFFIGMVRGYSRDCLVPEG